MVPITESFNPKNLCVSMALLHKEGDYSHEDKRVNKVQRADTCQNLKRQVQNYLRCCSMHKNMRVMPVCLFHSKAMVCN